MKSLVSIKNNEEIDLMRNANKIVVGALNLLIDKATDGANTKDLDRYAENYALDNYALPAFKNYKGYPASICISINNQVVHGIPSEKKILKDGDVVSIDFGVNYKGYFGDAALTLIIGQPINEIDKQLVKVTKRALELGIAKAKNGNRIVDISKAIQDFVESNKFHVVKQFVGHGIGKNLHEPPEVPNYYKPGYNLRLKPGMVLAIEPMVNIGTSDVNVNNDGWTVVTKDKSNSAHFEHSVLITDNEPEILSFGIKK